MKSCFDINQIITFWNALATLAYPYLRDFNKNKFDFHTSKCIFIGYSSTYIGYKYLTSSGKVYILKHVVFDENLFPYSTNPIFTSSENITKPKTLVSNFSQQQIYYLSTLPLLIGSFKDIYSAESAENQQIPYVSTHADTLHQQEHSNNSLSISSC